MKLLILITIIFTTILNARYECKTSNNVITTIGTHEIISSGPVEVPGAQLTLNGQEAAQSQADDYLELRANDWNGEIYKTYPATDLMCNNALDGETIGDSFNEYKKPTGVTKLHTYTDFLGTSYLAQIQLTEYESIKCCVYNSDYVDPNQCADNEVLAYLDDTNTTSGCVVPFINPPSQNCADYPVSGLDGFNTVSGNSDNCDINTINNIGGLSNYYQSIQWLDDGCCVARVIDCPDGESYDILSNSCTAGVVCDDFSDFLIHCDGGTEIKTFWTSDGVECGTIFTGKSCSYNSSSSENNSSSSANSSTPECPNCFIQDDILDECVPDPDCSDSSSSANSSDGVVNDGCETGAHRDAITNMCVCDEGYSHGENNDTYCHPDSYYASSSGSGSSGASASSSDGNSTSSSDSNSSTSGSASSGGDSNSTTSGSASSGSADSNSTAGTDGNETCDFMGYEYLCSDKWFESKTAEVEGKVTDSMNGLVPSLGCPNWIDVEVHETVNIPLYGTVHIDMNLMPADYMNEIPFAMLAMALKFIAVMSGLVFFFRSSV